MARVTLTGVDLTIDGQPQRSSTSVGAVGAFAVVIATALADRGITLTSCYLADMHSDIDAAHLCSAPGQHTHIEQRVLPAQQPGQTHGRACLLDHVAELQAVLAALVGAVVTIDVRPEALRAAAGAWSISAP